MSVTISEKSCKIENKFLVKEFFISDNRIHATKIINKLTDSILSGNGSAKEFAINFKCGFFSNIVVKADELTIDKIENESTEGSDKLIIVFKKIPLRDSEIIIRVIFELSEADSFFRKYIELSFADKGKKSIVLDYIELGGTEFSSDKKSWCLPEQKKSHVPGFAMSMGQPVYVDSFYFGCEFPASINTIENTTVTIRNFSGKTLHELAGNGSFKSYKYVCGVSESDNFAEVQKAFYSYIRSISKPVKLRIQYNSWFDNMLNITEENVTSSFLEVEKGLTKYGVKPIDSYVADDGWNDYSKGFWTFNSKFPDRLTPFANLSESLGSRFGVWVGPRGGYTNDTIKFARQIQKHGNGYVNKQAHDICVASEKYSSKTGEMMLEFMDSFHLNYFKLDGFAQYPCKNKKHDHMVGGYKDMYYYTDVWEKWIGVFEKMNKKAEENFWINLTCYAPPSPWFLQWVNSIWMQISNDVDFIGKEKEVSDKDRMLSYRDEMYFDFYKTRQFQLPQRVLYNHDPIYGNEVKVKMTDDEFRDYLFTMATRGTAFWELYYSHNLMNEAKWRINRSVLSFLEDNMEVLSHSVIFGGRPSQSEVYGFSCFNENEGIVSLRNSSGKDAEYTFCLNEEKGVSKRFPKSVATAILPYTTEQSAEKYGFGDSMKVTLKPYETKIFHFNRPFRAPEVTYVKARSERVLEVSFNQFVDVKNISCSGNHISYCELLEDYMTVLITFENGFAEDNSLILKGIGDISGHTCDAELSFDFYQNNRVTGGVSGATDFAVTAAVEDEKELVLMKQGNEILLEVTSEGKIRFRVGDDVLTSRRTVKRNVKVTALRERNGILKLYIDGKLDSGMRTENISLSGETALCSSENVIILNKAPAFNEV